MRKLLNRIPKTVRWIAVVVCVLSLLAAGRVMWTVGLSNARYSEEIAAVLAKGAEAESKRLERRESTIELPEIFTANALYNMYECVFFGSNPYGEDAVQFARRTYGGRESADIPQDLREIDFSLATGADEMIEQLTLALRQHASFLEDSGAAESVAYRGFYAAGNINYDVEQITLAYSALLALEGRDGSSASAEAGVRLLEALNALPDPMPPFALKTTYLHASCVLAGLEGVLSNGDITDEQHARATEAIAGLASRERFRQSACFEAARSIQLQEANSPRWKAWILSAQVFEYAREWDPDTGYSRTTPLPYASDQNNLDRILIYTAKSRDGLINTAADLDAAHRLRRFESLHDRWPTSIDEMDLAGVSDAEMRCLERIVLQSGSPIAVSAQFELSARPTALAQP